MSGSEREDIEALKQDVANIKRRLKALEQEQKEDVPQREEVPQPETGAETEVSAESKPSVGGIILLVIGSLLTLTVVGAIIGIPLIIIGLMLVLRTDKDKITYEPEEEPSDEEETLEQDEDDEELTDELPEDTTVSATSAHEPEKKAVKAVDSNLVLRGLTVIGIIALVLGAIFFLTLSIQNGWISKSVQLLIGIITGATIAVFGSRMRLKEAYAFWGDLVTSAGVIITYFTVYAAYALEPYRLALGLSATILGLALMIIAGAFLAYTAYVGSKRMTIGAIMLGALTFLFTELTIISLIYVAVLGIGSRAASAVRNWNAVSVASVVLTSIGIAIVGWIVDPLAALIALGILTATTEALAYLRREHAYTLGLLPLVFNGLIALALSSMLDWNLGIVSIAYASICIALAAIQTSNARISRALSAAFFLTIGTGLLVSPEYLGLTWAALAITLTYASQRFEAREYLVAGHIIAGIGFLAVMTQNLPLIIRTQWPAVLSLPAFYLMIAMTGAYAILSRMNTSVFARIYSALSTLLLVFITFAATSEPIAIVTVFMSLAIVYRMVIPDEFYHLQSVVLSGLAIITTVITDLAVSARGTEPSAWLYAIMIGAIIALNTYTRRQQLDENERWIVDLGTIITTVFFTRLISLISGGNPMILGWLGAGLAGFMLSTYLGDRVMRYSTLMLIGFSVIAGLSLPFTNALALPIIGALIAFIIYTHAIRDRIDVWIRPTAIGITTLSIIRYILEIAQGAGITLGWLAAGVAGLVIGITTADRSVRIAGLVLIGLAILKAFFLDVFELELVWRVVAFVVLGIALLASALLYGKYRDRIGELF